MIVHENRLMPELANHRRYCIEQLSIHKDVEGDVAELGIGCGKNAILLSCVIRDLSLKKKLYACDTFGGLPYSDKNSGIESELVKGECFGITYGQLKLEASHFGVSNVLETIVGLVEETLFNELIDKKFCFVWFDLDLYKPTSIAYKFFENRITKGGIIGFHDYEFKRCPGIKKVVDEEVNDLKFEEIFRRGTSIFFKRR